MAWSIIAPGHHQWTIRDFSLDNAAGQLAGPQSASTRFADCSQCRDSDRYDSPASALDHLYAHHFQGLSPQRSKWIFEDPLLVWIRKISPGPARALSENQIFPVVETMIDDLDELKEAIKSVHCVVASVSGGNDDRISIPFLPKALVHAFEKIVHIFIMKSKQLSLTNRFLSLDRVVQDERRLVYRRKNSKMSAEHHESLNVVHTLLDEAKTDILMAEFRDPTKTINSLGVEKVSSDFLAVMLIISTQQNEFEFGGVVQNAAKLFQDRLLCLKSEAFRHPKRRVFADLNELQQEMEACSDVLYYQIQTIIKSHNLLYGWGAAKYTESFYMEDHQRKLEQVLDKFSLLRSVMGGVRNEVKQSIDVLEEGHGRAIRVFTIVTLFFLPL